MGRLMTAWDWEPSILTGCAMMAAAYFYWSRARPSSKMAFFFAGVLLLVLDLISPLDRLGDEYLFSAHVVQHFVLALLVPPLLLLGIDRSWIKALLTRPLLDRAARSIGAPPVSWALGVGTMLLWHIPAFFNAALSHEVLHVVQHLSFLVTGTIFWWPIVRPDSHRYTSLGGSITYLFTACLACSFLGAALTFGSPAAYPAYLHPPDTLGILPMIRDSWGLDPKADQQLGGLLMWVPGCFVYLTAILWTVARWFSSPDYAEEDLAHG
jgi:putative membrane protein